MSSRFWNFRRKVITIIVEGNEDDTAEGAWDDLIAGLEEGIEQDLISYDTGFKLKMISIK